MKFIQFDSHPAMAKPGICKNCREKGFVFFATIATNPEFKQGETKRYCIDCIRATSREYKILNDIEMMESVL